MAHRIVFYNLIIMLLLFIFGCTIMVPSGETDVLKPEITSLHPEGITYSKGGFELIIGYKNLNKDYEVYVNEKLIKHTFSYLNDLSQPYIYCKISDEEINDIFLSVDRNNFKFNVRILNRSEDIKYTPIQFELGDRLSAPIELKINWDFKYNYTKKKRLFPLWNKSSNPILKKNKNGVLCLAWKEKIGDIYQAFFSFSEDNGDTWSQVLNISRSDKNVYKIDMEVDGENNFFLVWHEGNIYAEVPGQFQHQIYFSRSLDNGLSWFNPVKLSEEKNLSSNPAITINSKEEIFIKWGSIISNTQDSNSKDKAIYFSKSKNNGNTWDTKKIISYENNQYYGDYGFDESILEAGKEGLFYLINVINKNKMAIYRSVDNGITWGKIHFIDRYENYFSKNVSLKINKSGNPFVFWTNHNIWEYNIFYYNTPYISRGYELGEKWKDDIPIINKYYADQTTICLEDNNIELIAHSFISLFLTHSTDEGLTSMLLN